MLSFKRSKEIKSMFNNPQLSFHNLLTLGFAIQIGFIATLSKIILERYDKTTLYELLITVLILVIMIVFMIRNHITVAQKANTTLGKNAREISDYRQALDSSAIVAITNHKGVITYANDNFCRMSQYTREEIVGQTHKLVKSDHHPRAFFLDLWQTIANGKIWKGEIKNRAKDGTTYWVDTTIVPFLNEDGKPYQYLSIRFDITARKNAEEALHETEANLKTVFENTGSAYILMNNQLEIVAFNKLAEQFSINSLNREGRPGDYVVDYFPEERRALVEQNMNKVLEGEKIQYEVKYPQTNGSDIWYDVSLFPISKSENANYGLIMELTDVTQRKKAEESLRQSQANLTAIIQNTDSTIYSLDCELRYIAFNNAHAEILKQVYGLDIKPGDHVFDFLEKLDPKEAKGWQETYARALNGETLKFEKEFNVNNYDGFVSFAIHPIFENGEVIGLSCFTVDITQQKKEEIQKKKITQDLIQRNKDLEQFSYIISHNLRAPVANILGLANIMHSAGLSTNERKKTEEYLFLAVERLDDVVKDLNQTVNTKRNINEIKESIEFSQLVENIRCSIQSYISTEHVQISTDFSAISGIHSIRSYFHNIFYNLISNSIKYSHPGRIPLITIKSELNNEKIILRFKDNGMGIDLNMHGDKLFGLYNRFHNHSEGKGMGLFMVKTQVETLGGTIGVVSEVNAGTEFVIEFDCTKNIPLAA